MAKHSAGNLIFLLVFALLCGDWAEPAKASAAVGGHKALSKLLPASSNAFTTDILMAQAAKPNNFPDDQQIPLPGPDTKDSVTLWQLPEDFKSVIETDSDGIYGICYSAWNRNKPEVKLPGVYGAGWIGGGKNNNYQPWKDNAVLAEELSVKYLAQKQSFMAECDSSEDDGPGCVDEINGKKVKNLNLYGFWNGGGFAYGAIKSDQSVSRPSGGSNPQIGYYWNGELYRTNNGDNYKIQFFAGCKLNTINTSVSVSGLSSPEDCNNGTAPVLDGGSLNFDTKYSIPLYVTSKGGAIDNNSENIILEGTIQSIGGTFDSPSSLFFKGPGSTSLRGNNSYINPTIVKEGVLDLDGYDNKILGLSGGSRSVSDPGIVRLGTVCSDDEANPCIADLPGGVLSVSRGSFDGVIEDVPDSSGSLIKDGSLNDILALGGLNQYSSPTLIRGGVLKASADQALSPNSPHSLIGGELDLRGYQQVLPSVDIRGGVLRAESNNPLNVSGAFGFSDGRIVAYLNNGTKDDGANAPINVEVFNYQPSSSLSDLNHGIYAVVNPDGRTDEDNLNGTWRIIEGNVPNSDELAKKNHLIIPIQPGQESELDSDEVINVDGQLYYVASFDGLDTPLDAAALRNIVLEEGSLNIVVTDKTISEILDDSEAPVGELEGCEGSDQLCESLDDEQTQDILEGIITDEDKDGLDDELPVMHWGQLATLLGSGLTPRNVDAAGRGLALTNSLLVDAVFERQPLRQFDLLPTDTSISPHNSEIDEDQGSVVATADDGVEVSVADDLSLVDLQDEELDLANLDGVSAWVKGFGGNSRADDSSILYNDYDLSAYGTSFGVDVALSESFQIGAYANYGNLNVQHRSGDTGGGSWNPVGWGGGLTAQYSTRNFYVQGLLGAGEFSGEQSRNILDVTDELGGNTAKGDKTVTSYLVALRLGAPFKTGDVVLEPQGQVLWSQNNEHGFAENHGTEKNLRLNYKNRITNFVETQLGMKLSLPIRTGERALLVPSVRAAWLVDWDAGNEAQEIGYKFTNKTVDFDSELETQNGALIEAGLDYTIQNHNITAWKIYGRGGVELWDSDLGATWRASGGVTFRF